MSATTPTPQAADTGAAQGAGITAVGDALGLVEQLVRAEASKARYHEKYMGKVMPDDEYGHFVTLRDERIPELRCRVQAALAAAPQPAPPAGSVLEDASRYEMVRRGQHWSVVDGIGNCLRAEGLDAAVDAARKQRGAT